eukprot:841882-Pleurochrysis_carterae.AAC.4
MAGARAVRHTPRYLGGMAHRRGVATSWLERGEPDAEAVQTEANDECVNPNLAMCVKTSTRRFY